MKSSPRSPRNRIVAGITEQQVIAVAAADVVEAVAAVDVVVAGGTGDEVEVAAVSVDDIGFVGSEQNLRMKSKLSMPFLRSVVKWIFAASGLVP